MTPETLVLHEFLDARRDEFRALPAQHAATNLKLFGSVARGTAHAGSDIDILVEMDPPDGNLLMRASGLMEESWAILCRDDIEAYGGPVSQRCGEKCRQRKAKCPARSAGPNSS